MKSLGLDIGINSLGFCLVSLAEEEEHGEILQIGSRVFEAAENPKTGASLALPRRVARSQRRRLYRKAQRLSKMRRMLREQGLPIEKQIQLTKQDLSPWELRRQGMERALSASEFARMLIHFAKRPGFQSNRKSAPPKEEGPLLQGSRGLRQQAEKAGVASIGAYLAMQPKQRNDHGSYNRTVLRDDLRAELKLLFEKQRALGNAHATEELLAEVQEVAFYRRPLQSSLGLVGACRLEPDQKRAAKTAYHAELFIALSRLSTTRILFQDGTKRALTPDEIVSLEQLIHSKTKITFAQARKLLDLEDDATFNLARYRRVKEEDNSWDAIRDRAEKTTFVELPTFHKLRNGIGKISAKQWQMLKQTPDHLDQIAFALSFFEDEGQIRDQLKDVPLEEEVIVALLGLPGFSKTIDLSLKAAKQFLPPMRQGQSYGEVVDVLYPDHRPKAGTLSLLPPLKESTRNPVVDRALAQLRKVVNAIIRTHGMPDVFHVEMTRELGRNFDERKKETRKNEKRRTQKEEDKTHAGEVYGFEPNGEELAKFRLWKEQGCFCPYSGVRIEPRDLRDGTITQIDHILPYSRSFDDSWSNKVVCFASENQNKKNQTAYEYMEARNQLAELEDFAQRQSNKARRDKLLLSDFGEEAEKSWKARHLNDTGYIAREVVRYLQENLQPNPGIRKLVHTRKGQLTSKLRYLWGLPDKDRENDHRHHAVDAVVLACTTQSIVQRAARWSRYQRGRKGDAGFYAQPPWPSFRQDVKAAVETIFVSRQPQGKTGGKLHDDTILSLRTEADGTVRPIKRVRVAQLTLSMLDRLVDVEVVDGEPRGRCAALYRVLFDRLSHYGGDGKKAFDTPVYMPLKPGKTGPNGETHGPEIHSVRLYDGAKSGFKVRQGIAGNDSMSWCEVYEKAGKFYLLPVYAHQVASCNWPDRLIVANKTEDEWEETDGHKYLFSLRKNEYVKIKDRKGRVIEGYYNTVDRSTGALALLPHLSNNVIRIAVKTAQSIQKYEVDVFGQLHEKKEVKPWRGEPC